MTGKKRQKKDKELDVDLDSSVDDEDLSSLTTDDLCRRFLPMIPKINNKLQKITKALKTHTEEIENLNEKVAELDATVASLQTENEYLYKKVHENNLILTGLPETTEQGSILDAVSKLFEDKLEFTPDIQNAFRLGVKNEKRPRPIKITFSHVSERHRVWEKKKDLEHPYYVSEDVHKSERQRRGVIIAHAKKLNENAKSVKILFKRGEIIADGSTYIYTDGQMQLKRQNVVPPSA